MININNILKMNKNEPINIYVYMGCYKGTHELHNVDNSNPLQLRDLHVGDDTSRADYKRYRNIELSRLDEGYEINVPLSKCDKFEKTHIIIHTDYADSWDNYMKFREIFLSELYSYKQQGTLVKVKSKTKK